MTLTKSNAKTISLFLAIAFFIFFTPDLMASTGGYAEFTSSSASIMKLITGPVARFVVILAIVGCAVTYVWAPDLSGTLKTLVNLVFGASLAVGALNVYDLLFGSSSTLI